MKLLGSLGTSPGVAAGVTAPRAALDSPRFGSGTRLLLVQGCALLGLGALVRAR